MLDIELLIKAVLTLFLTPITLLHVYWLCGGKGALDGALPNDLATLKKRFSALTFYIGNFFALLPVILTLLYLIFSFYLSLGPLDKFQHQLYLFFSIIFIIRGLFGWMINKFTTKSIFIKRNTLFYSPIALFLGILLYILYKLS